MKSLRLIACLVAILTFGMKNCYAADVTPARQAQIEADSLIVSQGNPTAVLKLLADPDQAVRDDACSAMMMKLMMPERWVNASIVMKMAEIAESDPNLDVRNMAKNSLSAFTSASPAVISDLVDMGKSKDVATRRRALHLLSVASPVQGSVIQPFEDSERALCIQGLQDSDGTVRLAALDACAHLWESGSDPQNATIRSSIINAAFESTDLALRERAFLLLYVEFGLNRVEQADMKRLTKLAESNKPDEQALGQLFLFESDEKQRETITIERPAEDAAFLLRLQSLAQALHYPWYWVRAVATNRLFMGYLHVPPVNRVQFLLDAVSDPSAAVARDAALRLNNNLPVGVPSMSWGWARSHLVEPQIPEPPRPTLDLVGDVGLLTSAQTAQRLQGIEQLKAKGSRARSAIPALTILFSDPDAGAREKSRTAAISILKALTDEQAARSSRLRHPPGTRPTTAP